MGRRSRRHGAFVCLCVINLERESVVCHFAALLLFPDRNVATVSEMRCVIMLF